MVWDQVVFWLILPVVGRGDRHWRWSGVVLAAYSVMAQS